MCFLCVLHNTTRKLYTHTHLYVFNECSQRTTNTTTYSGTQHMYTHMCNAVCILIYVEWSMVLRANEHVKWKMMCWHSSWFETICRPCSPKATFKNANPSEEPQNSQEPVESPRANCANCLNICTCFYKIYIRTCTICINQHVPYLQNLKGWKNIQILHKYCRYSVFT